MTLPGGAALRLFQQDLVRLLRPYTLGRFAGRHAAGVHLVAALDTGLTVSEVVPRGDARRFLGICFSLNE